MSHEPLSGAEYDEQWSKLGDFIRYNPGARHRRRLCLALLRDLNPRSVADIGCGPGELLLLLRRHHPSIERFVGADFASETVATTQSALPWAEIHELDITTDSLGEQFELVTCCEVIEHLAEQTRAVAHLAAMVVPGGHLLLSCPTGPVFATERHFGHVHHPTPHELERLGQAAGLRTVASRAWGFPAYRVLKHVVNLRPELALRQFGSGSYGPAKRLINDALYWWSFASWHDRERACQLFWLFEKPAHRAVSSQ